MPKQTIFLTGATGKIGRILLRNLINEDYRIIALALSTQENIIYNAKIGCIYGDILDPSSYELGLKDADIVLHLAALTHTNNIKKYYEINSVATANLINKCKEYGVKRFIFVSTRAISEKGGHYSKSKLMAEKHVRESGLDWVILRLSEVYGIKGNTGIDMILNKIEKLPFVLIVGSGKYKIAPVHISDALFAIKKVIDKSYIKNKIYTIAGPESFTFNEFIDRVLETKKIKKIKVHIPIFMIRICAHILSLLKSNNFFVLDQLPRFFSEKSDDISIAVDELDFKPAALEERLTWK
jgi:nucleoside-diphosphate-sugar epimerase